MPSIYRSRDLAGVTLHYGGVMAIAVKSVAIAVNAIAFPIAAIYTAVTTFFAVREAKIIYEDHMQEHPAVHFHSPDLGVMAEELYKAAGIKSCDYPLYDHAISEDKAFESKNGLAAQAKESFEQMMFIPNAAAINFGKPVVIISQSLLQLLNREEEKAVLAHEFAHVVAGHSASRIPIAFVGNVSRITNALSLTVLTLSTGLMNLVAGVLGGIGMRAILRKSMGQSPFLPESTDHMNRYELRQYKQKERIALLFGQAVAAGIFTYANPAFLPALAGAVTIYGGTRMLEASFSRHNEYQADRGAVELGGNPLALITALRKVDKLVCRSRQQAWGDRAIPAKGALTKLWKELHYTHPHIEKRIDRLAEIALAKGYSEVAIRAATSGPVDISHMPNIPYRMARLMAAEGC